MHKCNIVNNTKAKRKVYKFLKKNKNVKKNANKKRNNTSYGKKHAKLKIKRKRIISVIITILIFIFCFEFKDQLPVEIRDTSQYIVNEITFRLKKENKQSYNLDFDKIPEFDGEHPYIIIDENKPSFRESELSDEGYIRLSEQDEIGRCGVAEMCAGRELMPNGDRESIGMVKPSGWHTVRYDGIIDGNYLYNRCHLLMWALSGLNADERNLITGTRFLNIE